MLSILLYSLGLFLAYLVSGAIGSLVAMKFRVISLLMMVLGGIYLPFASLNITGSGLKFTWHYLIATLLVIGLSSAGVLTSFHREVRWASGSLTLSIVLSSLVLFFVDSQC